MSHFPILCVHTQKLYICIPEGCSVFEISGWQVLGMGSIGWNVVAVVLFGRKQCWWLEREVALQSSLGAPGDGNHPPIPLDDAWHRGVLAHSRASSLCWQWELAASPVDFWFVTGKKRQRESCAKYSLCHLFSLLWHLCKLPLLYCLLLTIKQHLSGSLFLFQRWCRTLIRWCQKASGDFALSTRAL